MTMRSMIAGKIRLTVNLHEPVLSNCASECSAATSISAKQSPVEQSSDHLVPDSPLLDVDEVPGVLCCHDCAGYSACLKQRIDPLSAACSLAVCMLGDPKKHANICMEISPCQ